MLVRTFKKYIYIYIYISYTQKIETVSYLPSITLHTVLLMCVCVHLAIYSGSR